MLHDFVPFHQLLLGMFIDLSFFGFELIPGFYFVTLLHIRARTFPLCINDAHLLKWHH